MNPLIPRESKWYGWRPDTPDPRDRLKLFAAHRPELYEKPLPASVDLRSSFGPCYNQGETSSCTANALAGAIEFLMAKGGCPVVTPSRLFIYWNERYIEGDTDQDNGAMLRDGISSLKRLGYTREALWPFDPEKLFDRPSHAAFDEADDHQITRAFKLVTARDFKVCLAAGYPFVFGMMVYPEFESKQVGRTGTVSLPGADDRPIGGHAVLCVGYDDLVQEYMVRNSWDTDWGKGGYFTLPYDYMHNPDLCSDFWTLRKTESDVFLSCKMQKN